MGPKGSLSFDESSDDVVAERVVITADAVRELSIGVSVDDVDKAGASDDDKDGDVVTLGVTEM